MSTQYHVVSRYTKNGGSGGPPDNEGLGSFLLLASLIFILGAVVGGIIVQAWMT
jgi:hypothetical protein